MNYRDIYLPQSDTSILILQFPYITNKYIKKLLQQAKENNNQHVKEIQEFIEIVIKKIIKNFTSYKSKANLIFIEYCQHVNDITLKDGEYPTIFNYLDTNAIYHFLQLETIKYEDQIKIIELRGTSIEYLANCIIRFIKLFLKKINYLYPKKIYL